MRRMPGECGRKSSFARNLRQSAQSKERVEMPTLPEEIKRHVVRIRIGSERNTLGGRIRIPFAAPWPKYNAPLVRDPETPTQRGPRRAQTDQTLIALDLHPTFCPMPFIAAQATLMWSTSGCSALPVSPRHNNQGALDATNGFFITVLYQSGRWPVGENTVQRAIHGTHGMETMKRPTWASKERFRARRLAASGSLIGRNRSGGPPDSDACTLRGEMGNGWRENGLCGDAGGMAFGRRI